jgi:translocator protein
MKERRLALWLLSFVLCFGAAGLGSAVTTSSIQGWYGSLIKPSFNPPNWIFAPVWTMLYILMAIALAVAWNSKSKKKENGIRYFYMQLALNVLWSVLFFGLHIPVLALLEIIVLWVTIYLTMREFFNVSKFSGWLLVPYLAWVSFATILNASIVVLN